MAKEGILLESGTNEVELLEFILDGQSLGVNVLKIQAIEQFDPSRITHIQLADPSVVGTLLFRDHCVTMVDLAEHLRETRTVPVPEPAAGDRDVVDEIGELVEESAESAENPPHPEAGSTPDNKLVLVMEFNDRMNAFLVDGVNRIHRVSWGDISPMSPYLNRAGNKFTGSIQIDDREILIVDMEKIVTEILPTERLAGSVVADPSHPHFHRREELTIFLAEDSSVIRDRVEKELAKANYTRVISLPQRPGLFRPDRRDAGGRPVRGPAADRVPGRGDHRHRDARDGRPDAVPEHQGTADDQGRAGDHVLVADQRTDRGEVQRRRRRGLQSPSRSS